MKQILSKIAYEMDEGRDTMLVTLIEDRGSAPRSAGAVMLIGKQGRLLGTIGGGGLEYRAEAIAQEQLEKKESLLHTFALRPNSVEDLGVVCGGDVTVLFQYVAADDANWKQVAQDAIRCMEAHVSGKLLLPLDGSCATLQTEDGKVQGKDAFPLDLPIGERVVIFGAGHVAQALCPLLTSVGFRVTIVDDRPAFANQMHFPTAEQILVTDMNHLEAVLTITADDYLVVMTSGHTYDAIVEEQILRGPFAYVGVMASRRKTEVVNALLREKGISAEALARVHTPIGMDIKASTPEELAVSICGEMIRVRAERKGA